MPWFKADDNLAFHAKTVAAGNPAMGLWIRAGTWCAGQLTDGFIPDHMLASLGTPATSSSRPSAPRQRRHAPAGSRRHARVPEDGIWDGRTKVERARLRRNRNRQSRAKDAS